MTTDRPASGDQSESYGACAVRSGGGGTAVRGCGDVNEFLPFEDGNDLLRRGGEDVRQTV